ncbi:MAG: N-acetylmuramoyl-L-alanine amidase [Candidatus Hydrogenedentes bacterium]|nr:N-acetylmuramoyl-L-alanine amidase [Candidatus Hydrogenedentota bacterium]
MNATTHSRAIILCLAALTYSIYAGAAALFEAPIGDTPKTATEAVTRIGDIDYVSLSGIIGQFGGGTTVDAARVQADFLGQTAWVTPGEREVSASTQQFQLVHPLRTQNNLAYIALPDVVLFFRNAFQINVAQSITEDAPPPEAGQTSQTGQANMEDLLEAQLEKEMLTPAEPPASDSGRSLPSPDYPIRTLIIDAGHGGEDSGAVGPAGFQEKNFTLAVALEAQRLLREKSSIQVLLIRNKDAEISDASRVQQANRYDGDFLLSIHAGAGYALEPGGFELFYRSEAGAKLSALQARYARISGLMAEYLSAGLEQAVEDQHGGIHEAPVRVLNGANMPSLLLEIGCLTRAEDEARMADAAYQTQIAEAIANSIELYLRNAR